MFAAVYRDDNIAQSTWQLHCMADQTLTLIDRYLQSVDSAKATSQSERKNTISSSFPAVTNQKTDNDDDFPQHANAPNIKTFECCKRLPLLPKKYSIP
jgi:hypothetical protein